MAKPEKIKYDDHTDTISESQTLAPTEDKNGISADDASKPQKERVSEEIIYEDRDESDARLSSVIADILSAEREAKHIIAKAEENAKAIQLDGATRARSMREVSARTIAEAKAQKTEEALKRAAAEREKRLEKARAAGEKLIAEKEKEIALQTDRLFKMLGGKT